MKSQNIKNIIFSPVWNGTLLHYFLSGVKKVSDKGIKFELLYLVLPFLHDDNILKKLNSTNARSTLSSFMDKDTEYSLVGKKKSVLAYKKATNESLILLSSRTEINISEYVSVSNVLKYEYEKDKIKKVYGKAAYNLGVILSKEDYINVMLRIWNL